MIKVFINGNQGTTGLRIFDRLKCRSDIELLSIDDPLRKDVRACAEVMDSADAVFLCLPDTAAKEAYLSISNPTVKIFDTSTAHRTAQDWAYGFAELSGDHREAIQHGTRIAVPGCHASGFISLVYPLISSGLMPADYPIYCHSLTGYSGGGKKMITEYLSKETPSELESPRQYGLSQLHKHIPEMQTVCSLTYAPIFSPIVDDYYCGMEVSVPIFTRLLNKSATFGDIEQILKAHYQDCPLIRVVPADESGFISANKLAGLDTMEITVTGNDERILLISRFDNLGKGASGAAIQCFNIAFGLNETTGLAL